MPYLNKRVIRVALGQEAADWIVQGGKIVNVYTGRIYPADIAIADDRIAAVGNVDQCHGPNTTIYDASQKLIAPGLIDAHVHPEVSKITLTQFANAVLPRGNTSIVCSLDQIGSVAGMEGMRWTLDEAKKTPLKVFHAGPSRLPYTTPASTLTHQFGPAEHSIAQKWPEAVGIWEYLSHSIMDFEEDVYQAAEMAIENRLGCHGHAPMACGSVLAACLAAGMRTEHETSNTEELAEKLENGLYGIVRRGTHTDNIPECIKVVTQMNLPTNRLTLCTDDIDCTDLTELGLIDYLVRYVIQFGIDPITAIQMATINAAEAYRIDHLVGSITPGRIADLVLLSDLSSFAVEEVIASGKPITQAGKLPQPIASPAYPPAFYNSMRLEKPITADQIYLKVNPALSEVKAMSIELKRIERVYRRHRREIMLPVSAGKVLPDPANDVLYATVTDRHSGHGTTIAAFVTGFKLKRGAIATSVSPDDNNIICIGASVEDMAIAINRLFALGGGQIAVDSGTIAAEVALPVCGVMADIPAAEMAKMEKALTRAAQNMGCEYDRPFFRILFLSITGSPGYSITDRGLIDNAKRTAINPILES